MTYKLFGAGGAGAGDDVGGGGDKFDNLEANRIQKDINNKTEENMINNK